MSDEKKSFISVKVGPKAEKGKVAIWEVNPAHPQGDVEGTGEIFISEGADNDKIFKVGNTLLVEEKIRAGALVQVADAKADAPAPKP